MISSRTQEHSRDEEVDEYETDEACPGVEECRTLHAPVGAVGTEHEGCAVVDNEIETAGHSRGDTGRLGAKSNVGRLGQHGVSDRRQRERVGEDPNATETVRRAIE